MCLWKTMICLIIFLETLNNIFIIFIMVYYKLLFSCETKNVEAISTGGANYE